MRLGKKRNEKSPFMLVKEDERAVIITLEALDCNLPPLCVNLCIHQVFTGSLCKEPRSFCLHLSENTADRLGRGTRYLFTSQCIHNY